LNLNFPIPAKEHPDRGGARQQPPSLPTPSPLRQTPPVLACASCSHITCPNILLSVLLQYILIVYQAYAQLEPLAWEYGPSKKEVKFYYNEPREPYMLQMREEFDYDELAAGAKTDLERARIVCDWVHKRWEHKGDCEPPKNDPIRILKDARRGMKFSCREYALVAAGCLNSLGIRARIVQLMPKDVANHPLGSYHYVTQAYLNDRKKWIMIDPQWNIIPMLKNYPLSIVELQPALAKGFKGLTWGVCTDSLAALYKEGIGEYLYFLIAVFDNRVEGTALPRPVKGGLMLVPIGCKVPGYFDSLARMKITVTNNLSEFYGMPY